MSKLSQIKRGFTLVELLVVIGIIALLISILLPALSRARAQGMRTVCLTHLREWGLAFSMYAQENKGYYPHEMLRGMDAAATIADWQLWYGHYPNTPLPHGGGAFANDDSLLNHYLPQDSAKAIFNDPALDSLKGFVQAVGTISTTDAGMAGTITPDYGTTAGLGQLNSLTAANSYTIAVNITAINDPTETMLLADCATLNNTGILRYMSVSQPNAVIGSGVVANPTFHGRHPGGGNVLWYDGHVTTEPVAPIPASLTIAGFTGSFYNQIHLGHLMPKGLDYTSTHADFYFWLNKSRQNIFP
jgi:prepilin-type N-terminal cleavage/methylation domain-containing protein/prepilin-type processing-associated H-X9-DG protein